MSDRVPRAVIGNLLSGAGTLGPFTFILSLGTSGVNGFGHLAS